MLKIPSVADRLQGSTIAGRRMVTLERARAEGGTDFLRIPFLVPDPDLGWRLRPGSAPVSPAVTIDRSLRRLSAPPDWQPAPDALQVALLGDSFTFGFEVADDQTWAWALRAQTGADVANHGVLGYGLDQVVLHWERDVASTSPDVVVLGWNTLQELRCAGGWDAWAKPWFTLDGQTLALHGVPVPSPETLLGARSRPAVLDVLDMWTETLASDKARRAQLDGVTDALFERLRSSVQASGATLVVALFLTEDEYADPRGLARSSPKGWVRFDTWCADPSLVCVDLRAPFVEAYQAGVPLTQGAHWTPQGHALVADAVARALAR